MNILRVRDANGKWVNIPAIKGVDGKDGADGKDYVLTDADKQEIANLVIAQIPVYSGEMEDV
jgi:hypothetical protein